MVWRSVAAAIELRRRYIQNRRQSNIERPTLAVTPQRRHSRRRPSESSNNNEEEQQPLPAIYILAKQWAWETVRMRCASHPEEVTFVDHGGDSLLHWLCLGKPPRAVVVAVLDVVGGSGELAQVANRRGELPLHVACAYQASPDVIDALVQAYPEAVCRADRYGTYAAHHLCAHGRCTMQAVESLRQILQSSPQACATVHEREHSFHRRPLDLLNYRRQANVFDEHLKRLRGRRWAARLSQNEESNAHRCSNHNDNDDDGNTEFWEGQTRGENESTEVDVLWQMASLLLVAEVYGHPGISKLSKNGDESLILHACATSPTCPPNLWEYGFLRHADQWMRPDSMGNLCIHTLLRLRHRQLEFLPELLRLAPACAAVPCASDGKLPLAQALSDTLPLLNWECGIGALIQAHPVAIHEVPSLRADVEIPYILSRLANGSACRCASRLSGDDSKVSGSSDSRTALYLALRSRPHRTWCTT